MWLGGLLGGVVHLGGHLVQHVVQPQDVGLGLEWLPVVAVRLLHLPVDVKLVVTPGLVLAPGREQGGVLG